jgi:hypothetical protein
MGHRNTGAEHSSWRPAWSLPSSGLDACAHAGRSASVSGFDALEVDTKTQPPDRELGQTEEGGAAGKGGTVVGADTTGQPKSLKARSSTVKA